MGMVPSTDAMRGITYPDEISTPNVGMPGSLYKTTAQEAIEKLIDERVEAILKEKGLI